MSPLSSSRTAIVAVGLLTATACVGPAAHRSALPSPRAASSSVSPPPAVLLEAVLGTTPCRPRDPHPRRVAGFARIELRDEAHGTELEYELVLKNLARLRLAEGVITVSSNDGDGSGRRIAAVLWSGATYAKPRMRMRGIVPLYNGVTASSVVSALRAAQGAVELRISDASGAPVACGELRE